MSESTEPLTLDELQLAKGVLEARVHRLRLELHALRSSAQQDWRAQFAGKQLELIAVVNEIGGLNRRIYKVVEDETGPQEDFSK